ncbi:tetratricopeptide repeat protein [Siccirubricoccus deserti]
MALLAAALLSACAAGGLPGSDRGPRSASGLPLTGAFGSYLAGRFASSETDTRAAADSLLAALRADPGQPELLTRAFVATLLDGRSEAMRLARRLPENAAANLLLAGADVQAGRWERAEQRLRTLGRSGPVQVLQPALLAWVQYGRGQPDQALATLRPLVEGNRLRALNALHAALIADVASRPREAERLARMAVADQPQPPWRLAVLAAGILHRAGRTAEANRLLDQIVDSGEDAALAAAEPARRGLFATRGVASPADGMAEAYTALAGALRGQGSNDFALILAQLALRLRPGFAPALVLTADALGDQGHEEQALAVLDGIAADDPLAPVVGLRRATLLDKLDRTEEAVELLRRLAQAWPTMPQPAARLGDLLRRRNRFAEAAAAYDQALARSTQEAGQGRPRHDARLAAVLRPWHCPRAFRRLGARRGRSAAGALAGTRTALCAELSRLHLGGAGQEPGSRQGHVAAGDRCGRRMATSPTAWAGCCSASATCRARSPGWRNRWNWSRAAASSTTISATPIGPRAGSGKRASSGAAP